MVLNIVTILKSSAGQRKQADNAIFIHYPLVVVRHWLTFVREEGSMRATQLHWNKAAGWQQNNSVAAPAHLVLYFGTREALTCGSRYRELRALYPDAHLLGCSTGGQIRNADVSDDEIAAVAMRFEHTRVKLVARAVANIEESREAGNAIGCDLMADDLKGVFVLADGLQVNGTHLVAGITGAVGDGVTVTGGLAGDGALFSETLVGADDAPRPHVVGAVGFYGAAIRIGHGSAGGWDPFGPRRRITRSQGNILFELDGQPALALYERYLGEEDAKGLPGTALLFPLIIQDPLRPDHEVVRTIVGIDREHQALIFAGDMPEGWLARLMRGNFEHLAAGAAEAARQADAGLGDTMTGDAVSVMISCIGRRLLLGQRITDEVEAAVEQLRSTTRLGFFSYGEISPHWVSGCCELHNQTMTVTALSEAA
jgi:hypothetical protein